MLIDIDSKTKEEVRTHVQKVICKPEQVSLIVVYYQGQVDHVVIKSCEQNDAVHQLLCGSVNTFTSLSKFRNKI